VAIESTLGVFLYIAVGNYAVQRAVITALRAVVVHSHTWTQCVTYIYTAQTYSTRRRWYTTILKTSRLLITVRIALPIDAI